ncbi:SAM-dependent methyltransferase [hydrothermal vent metagenome]|uniref:SAM-dependent methyltransferase n=1 Tax=hydrothermal vent metagenome TaxID=652676 RepID=A0A3B0SXF7_9ZZZZ
MNKNILKSGIQSFISKNIDTDIVSVLLKKPIFEGVAPKELAEQIESKKKCGKKLPTWFKTLGIYYPKKLSVEQASSEITARYKAQIVTGKSLIDLTGGLGVDSYFFSHKITSVLHCEIDRELSEIASHNFTIFGAENIEMFFGDGVAFLQKTNRYFNWLFLDPSRRNKKKGKVFLLSDCSPNVPEYLDLLFSKSDSILLKTSPILDITAGIDKLQFVKEVHIVAVNNEVKELLWVMKKDFIGEITIKTINFSKQAHQVFDFRLSEEKETNSEISSPLNYLYEPNAAIMKSGGFKTIGSRFLLKKLHEHTHLYTSNKLIVFPGRRFEIEKCIPYNKNDLKTLGVKKANITTRNFPDSVVTIRNKFKIKDGGEIYLFFIKNLNEKHLVLICRKI